MKLFLLGAINRVFHPGCKFEYLLCLVGGQGAGKSSFIRFLACCDEWFCDDIKRLDDEKIYEHLVGHWILEIAEMLALNNAKCNEATKAFLSRQYDNYRLPYGYRAEDRPRQCVFAGTSNIVHFLPNDRSGNRRFLPIMCNAEKAEVHILENEEASREYIHQLWAEAMQIYKTKNPKLRLPKEIEKNLVKYQEPFMQEDTWADLIKTFLEEYTDDIVCTQLLYREALDMYGMPNRIETSQIMEIMSRIDGWVRFNNPRRFKNYKRQKGWERVTTSAGNQPDNQVPENSFKKISIEDTPFKTP
jgi:predicted P-loop ATPase